MGADTNQRRPLDRSLERLDEALARSRASTAAAAHTSSAASATPVGSAALATRTSSTELAPARSTVSLARPVGIPLLGLLLVVLLWLGTTAGYFFLIPAVFAGLALVAVLTRGKATPSTALVARAGAGPHVGMGATVASDAVLQDGSVVEMGASIGAGAVLEWGALVEMGASVAVLERGAVVRMGASVGPRAVLEQGAAVSWGASVGEGAVIGTGTVIAAGSEVAAGARVPAHSYLAAGTSWTATAAQGDARRLPAAQAREAIEVASDPRAEQIGKVCDRLALSGPATNR